MNDFHNCNLSFLGKSLRFGQGKTAEKTIRQEFSRTHKRIHPNHWEQRNWGWPIQTKENQNQMQGTSPDQSEAKVLLPRAELRGPPTPDTISRHWQSGLWDRLLHRDCTGWGWHWERGVRRQNPVHPGPDQLCHQGTFGVNWSCHNPTNIIGPRESCPGQSYRLILTNSRPLWRRIVTRARAWVRGARGWPGLWCSVSKGWSMRSRTSSRER